MAHQTMSIRRIVITNLLILLVIGTVCYLSFSRGVVDGISNAVGAPVYVGSADNGSVALEIALCDDADPDACLAVLQTEGVFASLFLCPELMENDPGLMAEWEAVGFHTGIYDCPEHGIKDVDTAGRMILGDYTADLERFAAFSKKRRVLWTMDANLSFASDETGAEMAEGIYENGIILYRFQNDTEQLKKLIGIIRQKGYNITDVKSLLE